MKLQKKVKKKRKKNPEGNIPEHLKYHKIIILFFNSKTLHRTFIESISIKPSEEDDKKGVTKRKKSKESNKNEVKKRVLSFDICLFINISYLAP